MKIFISGKPMVGKTTLIKRIIEEFGIEHFFGFWTEEIREGKTRSGFILKTTWGVEKLFASKKIKTNYRVGKYYLLIENIDEIVDYILNNLNKNKIIVIEEIGRMEWYSEKFRNLINKILREEYDVLATVHRNYVHLVTYYYWLDIGKWWEVYENVKKNIKDIIKYKFL